MIRCYITDRRSLGGRPLLETIARNLAAGVAWVQIREKDLAAHELYALVGAALALERPGGARIIVNSRMDVALAAGAGGVHLPSDSPPAGALRRLAPEGFLIGVSCHTLEEVAAAEGADYVLYGPVFAPLSKGSDVEPRGLPGLARAAASARMPVLALGGVTEANTAACIAAGAAGVAAISLFQRATRCAGLKPGVTAD